MNTKTVSTNNPASQQERTDRTAVFRAQFKSFFDRKGVRLTSFMPKILFLHKNMAALAIYRTELDKPEGFYTILVDRNFLAKDGLTKMYHLPFNPHWEKEYDCIEDDRFAVPFTEFKEVDITAFMMQADLSTHNTTHISEDEPVANMTIRDVAAMLWKEPVSTKAWLNNLILKQTKQ